MEHQMEDKVLKVDGHCCLIGMQVIDELTLHQQKHGASYTLAKPAVVF